MTTFRSLEWLKLIFETFFLKKLSNVSELYFGNLTLLSMSKINSRTVLKILFLISVKQFNIFENKTPIFPFLSV